MTTDPSNSAAPVTIRLVVKGLGHVPSKKNQRMAVQNSARPGLRIISRPESKAWCERLIQSFVLQCISFTQTTGFVTTPGHTKLSAIALCLPHDDSRQWIPETVLLTRVVPKGHEGAEILIERL